MDKEKIISKLQDVFRDVFENDGIILNLEAKATDIEGWDSLGHLQLVVAIEKHFKVKFSTNEIFVWKNVGDIIESLSQKLQ